MKIISLLALTSSLLSASTLILINPNDQGSISFQGTGNAPLINTNSFISGVIFENGLASGVTSSDFSVFEPLTGNLSANGTSEVVNSLNFSLDPVLGEENNFAILTVAGSDTAIFSTASAAFTGLSSVDILESSFPGGAANEQFFQPLGTIGNLVVDGEVIGQWQVVPEASSMTLLGISFGAFVLRRKRRS